MGQASKKTKASRRCRDCKQWPLIRERVRVGESLAKVIEKMEAEIKRPELKTTMVGNDSLQMTSNRYRNMMVRITRGRGVGQERAISAITDKALTVAPAWDVVPDASSFWVETGWQFGALSRTSPVQFAIPNRSGRRWRFSGARPT